MRIIHVVPHIDQEASGPSYSVPRLCTSLAARGHDVELSCLAARGTIPGVRLDVHAQWPILRRFAISPEFVHALQHKVAEMDIVHNHSLWSMANVAAGWVVPGQRAKLVTSPRGTLAKWALERRRNVKGALWPLQRRALVRASLLHATSTMEYADIRACGIAAPVAIIPNGIDVPVSLMRVRADAPRTVLYLGRLHPVKGIDQLLRGWGVIEDRHVNWRLVVVGRGEPAHERQTRDLAEALELRRVEFVGPLYGAEKSSAYFGADLYVLPSHSENFGMTVAEALAHGCPVLVSRGTPWAGVEEEGCGWWVDHNVADIADALDRAMSLPRAALLEMGAKGHEWMRREFGWSAVAARMETSYAWVLGHADRPSWVCIE